MKKAHVFKIHLTNISSLLKTVIFNFFNVCMCNQLFFEIKHVELLVITLLNGPCMDILSFHFAFISSDDFSFSGIFTITEGTELANQIKCKE